MSRSTRRPSPGPTATRAVVPGDGTAAAAPGAPERIGAVFVALTGALAGLLEALLVPYYIGTVIVPVAVLLAVASNIALPRLARSLVPTTLATAAPFVAWLLVMIGFGVIARPEGDVILPGGTGLQWVTYGVLLGGALVGTINLVVLATPAPPTTGRSPVSR
jgi:hypothetical protein